MDRSLVSQALIVGLPAALAIEKGITEVDVGEFDVLDGGDGLLYEELLPIRPCHPAPSPVVQMGAPDLKIHRDGRPDSVPDFYMIA